MSNLVDAAPLDRRDTEETTDQHHGPPRSFDIWSMLALSFSVLGTWSTGAQGLATGLYKGGPITVLWGLCVVAVFNVCIAVSLGELCSSMPNALGQGFWIARLWDSTSGRFTSYICAWINIFGWWTLSASQMAFMTEFTLGLKIMFDTDWTAASKGWVHFLLYLGITWALTLVNLTAGRKDWILPTFNKVIGVWFVGLFVAFSLAMPISVRTNSDLAFQPASFVFWGWLNRTGWSDGVAFFMGLVQAAYSLTGYDCVIHMVEEIPSPGRNAPKAMYLSVILGAVTGFIFMVICLFCIQNVEQVFNPPTGLPFIEVVQESIGLEGGFALILLFVLNGLGQGVSMLTTASRLTWSFAREGGLPRSAYFAHIDRTWKVPVRAILLQALIISLVGLLYLFSSAALDAILSVSTVALTISSCIPILVLLLVGRKRLVPGDFNLGVLGPAWNWMSIVYCAITTVFFFFPRQPDPPAGDMNYAVAVFGIMVIVAVGFWFTKGRSLEQMT